MSASVMARGVLGRRVTYLRTTWTVRGVGLDGRLSISRVSRNRIWLLGGVDRAHVRFVRGNYMEKK